MFAPKFRGLIGTLLALSAMMAVSCTRQDETGAQLTLANYEAIQTGMSYKQVVAILDEDGTEMSRTELAGHTTVMYMWKKPSGANMNAMFEDDKLINKAQFGLK